MSNEIYNTYKSGFTLYAVIRKQSDDTVNIQGTDTFEVWNDANILTYDFQMTDNGGDYYSVDFPTAITGTDVETYRIEIFLQTGGSAAITDYPIAQGELFWQDGKEIDLGIIYNSNQTVTNVYDESSPPPITVINESVGRV
jgi:hypothetical protein